MATRIKNKTLVSVPQSKNDCAESIRLIGDLQRDFERERAAMNDDIAAITQRHQPVLAALTQRIEALQSGVQAWCEAHRVTLCGEDDKLGKTANLVTGEVSWRQRPPSVSIRGVEAVLETLQRTGLVRFIRAKNEPNKEAMLAEPDAVRGIAGISIVTGVEDFIITPFEAKAEIA
ncbi:MAG: host-nuclease inhibitor Gam family protein [Simplicispira sp.]|nr:host-nuclease inhibitor Gam family protein [Simplicispira sp.]